jgi:alanine dehydrogenase
VTVPYALQIANKGINKAIKENLALKLGVNTANHHITHEVVAKDLDYEFEKN